MNMRLSNYLVFLVFFFLAATASGQQVVAEFSGNNNTTTREFEVQGPWILNWRVTGNYTGSVGFELALLDGKTRMHKGVILRIRHRDNGVKLFEESGTFRFRISSGLADWHLKVEEITEEEAALYTPRKSR